MAEVHRIFSRKGFVLNYAKGKSSAVLTFVGKDAPRLRQERLLCPDPGTAVAIDQNTAHWLPFVTHYKHLGAQFASSHSLEPELNQRIGMARAAFTQTFRPILGNRNFPVALRLRFLQSLIFSRLFFGMGSWSTPTLAQLKRLRTVYHQMLRKVLRCSPDEQLSKLTLITL